MTCLNEANFRSTTTSQPIALESRSNPLKMRLG